MLKLQLKLTVHKLDKRLVFKVGSLFNLLPTVAVKRDQVYTMFYYDVIISCSVFCQQLLWIVVMCKPSEMDAVVICFCLKTTIVLLKFIGNLLKFMGQTLRMTIMLGYCLLRDG